MKTKGKNLSQLWKRNMVVAAIAVFVCAAVYLNWNYEQEVGKTLGESAMVGKEDPLVSGGSSAPGPDGSGQTEQSDGGGTASAGGSYFDTARLNRQQSRDSALALLQEAAGKGVWLAALCAAPILLGRWGLLDGRKATSYPTRHSQLGKAEVLPEARAVSDGKFVTGHACGSAFDFGLKLVEVLRGEEAARAVNDVIYYRR